MQAVLSGNEQPRVDLPGKTSRAPVVVIEIRRPPVQFVAPSLLAEPAALGGLLQLWARAFQPVQNVQLVLPVPRGADHLARAIAVVEQVAADSGVDLDDLADVVLTTIPGELCGVAAASARWIAWSEQAPPDGSGWESVTPTATALQSTAGIASG